MKKRKKNQRLGAQKALAECYDTAIKAVADAGFVNMEALANERAAFVFCKDNDQSRAEQYFSRALELNKNEWGATAKYGWLDEKSELALSSTRADTWGGNLVSSGLVGNTIAVSTKNTAPLAIIEEEA
jgi:hypothetical protein